MTPDEKLSEAIAARRAVRVLNSALDADPQCLQGILRFSLVCSEAMAEHPTVQVQAYGDEPPRLSPLGLINGLFGMDDRTGYGHISMFVSDDNSIEGFVLTDHDALPDQKTP